MGDRDDGSGKSSQSRQRSASKVVTESSAFGLESRHRVVAGLCRDLLELLTSLNCQSSPCARNLPPGEIANSAKWWLEDNLYDNSLTDHLGRDRPTNSSPYARKCAHGHMYNVLETFQRAKSPTRLSGGWRQLVRQLSDRPSRA